MEIKLNKPMGILYSDNGQFKPYPQKIAPNLVIRQMRKNILPEKYRLAVRNGELTLMSRFGIEGNFVDAYAIVFYTEDYIARIWDINLTDWRGPEYDGSFIKTIINGNTPIDAK